MMAKHRLFEAFEFSDEEKEAIGWQESVSPTGIASWQFQALAPVRRTLTENERRRLLEILEMTVQNVRVDAWPMFMGAMLKLGYVLPEG